MGCNFANLFGGKIMRKKLSHNSKIRAKRAQLVADAVSVLCPACGEPQPNFAGSEQWTAEDFRELANTGSSSSTCSSCDAPIMIFSDTKVIFDIR
jgi:hypothetical protein